MLYATEAESVYRASRIRLRAVRPSAQGMSSENNVRTRAIVGCRVEQWHGK